MKNDRHNVDAMRTTMDIDGAPTPRTAVRDETTAVLDPLFEVVLHNDDVHAMEYVVDCLIRVFKHPEAVAIHVMLEAHTRGRAVAEVEHREQAEAHRDQLQALGLGASAQPVGAGV